MSHMVAYELRKLCGSGTMGLPGDTGLYKYMPRSIGNYGVTWDTILSVVLHIRVLRHILTNIHLDYFPTKAHGGKHCNAHILPLELSLSYCKVLE